MKRLVLILALATGLSTLTYAKGDKKTPEQKAAHTTEVLKKKLTLTADQSAKVKAILLSRDTEVAALKKSKSNDDKQAKDAIDAKTDTKMAAVLNATQKKAYEDWKAAKKEAKAEKKKAKAKKA